MVIGWREAGPRLFLPICLGPRTEERGGGGDRLVLNIQGHLSVFKNSVTDLCVLLIRLL